MWTQRLLKPLLLSLHDPAHPCFPTHTPRDKVRVCLDPELSALLAEGVLQVGGAWTCGAKGSGSGREG